MIDTTLDKIKSIDELSKIVAGLKGKGKEVVLCHGVFDIVHLGHIRHFNLAKKEGDILVVSTTSDQHVKRGPGRPFFNENLRAETLASLQITDYVCIIDAPTATDFIKALKPDVYVKGSEYKQKEKDVTGMIYEEEEAVKSIGGRLAFTDDITFSSSSIINSQLDTFPPRTVKYLKAISKRYTIDYIVNAIKGLNKLKVLVIGDAIIDEYHYCTPMGRSSKAEVIVNKYKSEEIFAGGALATANNVASVCENVDLITVLGAENTYQDFIESKLSKKINPLFYYRNDTGTTVKRRFVSNETLRKQFQICYMNDTDIPKREETRIIKQLTKVIDKYDLVVVSDFGHGFLTERIRQILCEKSKYLALNVQTNSANAGFNLVTKYRHANCVCIDEMELRYAAHDRFGDVRDLSKKIYEQIGCEHIIATRGPAGSICYSKAHGFHETPAFSDKVIDPIGAGDAFFAFIAPCFAAGLPQEVVSFIGNAVGSLACQIVCNRDSVDSVDLIKFITRLLK
ncbi:MAG TPA: PfkB family carbohydrate kinase [Candidatus Omnitrophota bacterium]|nr:PfkB family carbohydrate kinase [Candidatus Omnitrophota bacterium]